MTTRFSATSITAQLQGILDGLDTGGGPATISFYTNPQRTAITDPIPGGATLIGTVVLTTPAGTIDSAGLHLTSAAIVQAVGSGVIGWGQVTDMNGVVYWDGPAREPADSDYSTATFQLDETTIFAGGFIVLQSALLST